MTTFAGQVEAFFTVPSGQSIAATNSGGGPTAVSITAGSYTPTTFAAHVQTRLNAVRTPANWVVTLSTGSSGTGKVSIQYTGSTYSITWTTTDTRDVLGHTANIVSAGSGVNSVGTYAARGLWQPDCPLSCDGDITQAPTVDDGREVVGPTGASVTLVGCDRYEHSNLLWSHVTIDRMWISRETTVNASYERFFRDAIRGNGHSWFVPGSPLKITDHAGSVAGSALPVTSWKAVGVPRLATLKTAVDRYTGLWRVDWPSIVSDA